MSKSIPTLLAVAAVTLGLAACQTYPTENRAPGHYESDKAVTRSDGTNVKTEKDTDVYYDENGVKKSRTTTTTTKDPEGLFNKSKSTSTKTTY